MMQPPIGRGAEVTQEAGGAMSWALLWTEHQVLHEDDLLLLNREPQRPDRRVRPGRIIHYGLRRTPLLPSRLRITRAAELRYIAIMESDGRECHDGDRRGRWDARGAEGVNGAEGARGPGNGGERNWGGGWGRLAG